MATDEERRTRKAREQKARAVFAAIGGPFDSHGMAEPPHGWKNFLDAVGARLLDSGVDADSLDTVLAEGDEALMRRVDRSL